MRRKMKGRIADKTEKLITLQSAKAEDVEFSALEADQDDMEALRRSVAADKRQLKEMFDNHDNENEK
ncbi:YfhD-like protein [Paenibacillus uliginis N3/975]|uniref:YfhD-like protein n=1 Tax=Paenibacillus uliginis N3/975 TaxID=1313296 RepID=A0A1X7HM45_9BACL|nr:YfhD family protein [Paenibacillus uliginis]SMF88605.1 YfhD-like protein [Paenibacillus uliginis N3/975]